MEVEERTAKFKSEYAAKIYYFCSPICKERFEKEPEKFVKPA
jgi:YHS domain-containing protein